MSERTRRIDHLLREEISAIIRREIHDPRVGFVTITGVDVTPDLRHATVWASVIGDAQERRATIQVLGRAMPFVRHQLGPLRLRRIPDLHLREDDTAQRGTRIMQLLDQLEGLEAIGTEGTADELAQLAALPELPTLPTPRPLGDPELGVPEEEEPLPTGYRRRVDRVALRKARERRGR
jgi:ribosome-binding factor A